MQPKIVIDNYEGRHNTSKWEERLKKEGLYKDRSTVIIIPTRGTLNYRVVQNWMGLSMPMNQKAIRMFIEGAEVGEAYESAIDMILQNEELSKWKYILTLEEDNLPPPDGLLKLYNAIDEGYDIVGGLYWTKGEGGMPMVYGSPDVFPINFIPQIPKEEAVTRCNGLGMGFTLFKMSVFKEEKIERPFFKTVQRYDPGIGSKAYTQDLYFFEKAAKAGYLIGCDSRVKVGHLDISTGIVW